MENFISITQTIESEIPGLKEEVTLTQEERKRINLFHTIICFSAYTEKMILSGNLNQVKKCMSVAEKLYKSGNETVKVAFEHIYIPRLHLEVADRLHDTVRTMLPFCLMRSYLLLYQHNQLEK